MKKRFHYFNIFSLSLLFLLVLIATTSCEKQYINFGNNFIENSITNLVLVDSSTVEISTVYVDSFVTSNTNIIFAGRFKDEKFGDVKSQSFLQMGLPASTNYDMPNGATFDSLEVILRLNKQYYGDTLSTYKIGIHQLLAPITYPTTQQFSFFNLNKREYDPTELGSNQLIVSPFGRDTIAIKLSPALGLDLFKKMQNKDGATTTLAEFISYFKGLAIVGGSANNLILGFSDSLIMRMHYHKPTVFTDAAHIDFSMNQANYQFNNITIDRAGSPIAALGPTNKQLFSPVTQNAGFSQYITGSIAKLSFPYLKDLYQLPNFIKIIKAQLIIKPVQASFIAPYNLPPYLRLSSTNKTNSFGPDLIGPSSTGAASVQYGHLIIDNLYGTETAYTYDVTNYLQAQIAITDGNLDGLLVSPPNPTATFNRILITNAANAKYKTQVKIYYASVK